MIDLENSTNAAETETGTCLYCYWWTRGKQAKRGECTKQAGRIVTDLVLERTRTAYPRTLSSEQCNEYKELR